MSEQIWRYIPPIEADGKTQMAIDEWLLEQHLAGNMPSVLRFYTWKPVAISLGYHQRKYPKSWHDLTYQGEKIDIVHRPSGGRAVLHQGDLTYAIITSGMKGDRCQVYKRLCSFLIEGFRELGIELQFGDRQRNYARHDNCFRTHTSADLVTNDGYKLIGSAQLRRKNAILQHGSIRLTPDSELYQKVFGETLQPSDLASKFSTASIFKTLCRNLSDRLNIELREKPLTPAEFTEIQGRFIDSSAKSSFTQRKIPAT